MAKEFCQQNTTVIAILHDINLAISFADRILFMKEGEIRHVVEKASLITPAIIEETFGVMVSVLHDSRHPKPIIVF